MRVMNLLVLAGVCAGGFAGLYAVAFFTERARSRRKIGVWQWLAEHGSYWSRERALLFTAWCLVGMPFASLLIHLLVAAVARAPLNFEVWLGTDLPNMIVLGVCMVVFLWVPRLARHTHLRR
jgi:hypothetical protein